MAVIHSRRDRVALLKGFTADYLSWVVKSQTLGIFLDQMLPNPEALSHHRKRRSRHAPAGSVHPSRSCFPPRREISWILNSGEDAEFQLLMPQPPPAPAPITIASTCLSSFISSAPLGPYCVYEQALCNGAGRFLLDNPFPSS